MLQQLQFHQASISGGRSGDHLAHDPTLPSSVPWGRRENIYVQNRRQKSFPV